MRAGPGSAPRITRAGAKANPFPKWQRCGQQRRAGGRRVQIEIGAVAAVIAPAREIEDEGQADDEPEQQLDLTVTRTTEAYWQSPARMN